VEDLGFDLDLSHSALFLQGDLNYRIRPPIPIKPLKTSLIQPKASFNNQQQSINSMKSAKENLATDLEKGETEIENKDHRERRDHNDNNETLELVAAAVRASASAGAGGRYRMEEKEIDREDRNWQQHWRRATTVREELSSLQVSLRLSLSLRCKGLFLYTGGVLCIVEYCVRQLALVFFYHNL